MNRLRKGEYDLVNISLIGFDPNTGRSFEACMSEWEVERARVLLELDSTPWWRILKQIKLRWQATVLIERRGY